MKFTFETENPEEANTIMKALSGEVLERSEVLEEPEPMGIRSNPEDRVEPETTDTVEALDSNGMAWDKDIHAGTKTKNADGSWKAQRGKKELADKAIADFKATNGNEIANVEPVSKGIPSAAPDDAAPPVTIKQVTDKIVSMLTRGILTQAKAAPIGEAPDGSFQRVLDDFEIDRSDPDKDLKNDETLRADLFEALCNIEPELI